MSLLVYLQGATVTLLMVLQEAVPAHRGSDQTLEPGLVQQAVGVPGPQKRFKVPTATAAEPSLDVIAARKTWHYLQVMFIEHTHTDLCTCVYTVYFCVY